MEAQQQPVEPQAQPEAAAAPAEEVQQPQEVAYPAEGQEYLQEPMFSSGLQPLPTTFGLALPTLQAPPTGQPFQFQATQMFVYDNDMILFVNL